MPSTTPTSSATFSSQQSCAEQASSQQLPGQRSAKQPSSEQLSSEQLSAANVRGTTGRWLQSLVAGSIINVAIWLVVTQVLSTSLRTQDELAIGGYEVQIPLVLITTFVATTVAALGRMAAGKMLRSPSVPWATATVVAGVASLMGPASAAANGNIQLGLSTLHVVTTAVVLGAHLRPNASNISR